MNMLEVLRDKMFAKVNAMFKMDLAEALEYIYRKSYIWSLDVASSKAV